MAEKNYKKLVLRHYQEHAQKHGLSLQSTMLDLHTREAEIAAIVSYLKEGSDCLEIGCGNGAASVEISKRRRLNLRCLDFSPDLIKLAKRQSQKSIKGQIDFRQADILKFSSKEKFDFVFTTRCIINLLSWKDQRLALENMVRVLKSGGSLILLEAFEDGLRELNQGRNELGLDPISPAYHNLHLNKEKVIKCMTEMGMDLTEENNFLSTYYFGSRIVYPALAKANRQNVIYNSSFAEFFRTLPNKGNYSHIKILVFKKN